MSRRPLQSDRSTPAFFVEPGDRAQWTRIDRRHLSSPWRPDSRPWKTASASSSSAYQELTGPRHANRVLHRGAGPGQGRPRPACSAGLHWSAFPCWALCSSESPPDANGSITAQARPWDWHTPWRSSHCPPSGSRTDDRIDTTGPGSSIAESSLRFPWSSRPCTEGCT